MPRVYFVGIDAGGSGTRAALVTEDGLVLALGSGGPSGVLGDAVGLRTLRRALSDALVPIEAYLRSKRIVVDLAGPDASDTDAADVRYPAHDNPKNASEPVHVNSPAQVDTQARASAARRTARATRPGEVGERPSSEVSPPGSYDVTASGPSDVNASEPGETSMPGSGVVDPSGRTVTGTSSPSVAAGAQAIGENETVRLVVRAGLRGLSVPGRRNVALAELDARFRGSRVSVSNDAVIAQWGGLGGQPGVAVLAGTGSIALARGADGREARSGGYGYLVSDEGGGYWLGREAIAACLQALDGLGPPTGLADILVEATKLAAVDDLVGWLYAGRNQVRRVARLAPLVAQAADAGDAVASAILERGAHALADLVLAAARQVWGDAPPDPLRVARCGGVWAAGPRLVEPFDRAVRSILPSVRSSGPRLPPVGGAVLLAMRAGRYAADAPPAPERVVAQLERSLAAARHT